MNSKQCTIYIYICILVSLPLLYWPIARFPSIILLFFFLSSLSSINSNCSIKNNGRNEWEIKRVQFCCCCCFFFFFLSSFWHVWSSFHWLDIVARYSIHRKFVVVFFSLFFFLYLQIKSEMKKFCVRYSMNIWHRQSSTTTKISFKVNQFGRRPTTNDQWSQNRRWKKRNFTPL